MKINVNGYNEIFFSYEGTPEELCRVCSNRYSFFPYMEYDEEECDCEERR